MAHDWNFASPELYTPGNIVESDMHNNVRCFTAMEQYMYLHFASALKNWAKFCHLPSPYHPVLGI